MSSAKFKEAVKEISDVHAEMASRTQLMNQKERALEKAKERYETLKTEAAEAKKAVTSYQATHKNATKKLLELGSSDPSLLQEMLAATLKIAERETEEGQSQKPADDKKPSAPDTENAE